MLLCFLLEVTKDEKKNRLLGGWGEVEWDRKKVELYTCVDFHLLHEGAPNLNR